MAVYKNHADLAVAIFNARLGNPYVYGGCWSRDDTSQGCDCSGEVTIILDACVNGSALQWDRHGLSTESYRYQPIGAIGPFGTVHVASPADIPADAAVKIALHHEGEGGPDSHMWCEVEGIRMETNGSAGTVTGSRALAIDSPYANDWWYLPGPLIPGGEMTQNPTGLDYAGGRPGGAAIHAAGYQFVVRYLSDGGASLPGKLLTPNEAADLKANGVDIVSNWETYADRMLEGYAAGAADAQAALSQHFAAGGPGYRPIYFSADFDATPEQQTQIDDYLRGAASVLGAQWVGIYGGYYPVMRALNNGTARWAWQTLAWSGGQTDPRINILQNIGTVQVGGVDCDTNEARTADYGQWSAAVPDDAPAPSTPATPAPTPTGGIVSDDAQAIISDVGGIAHGQPGVADGTPLWYRNAQIRHPRNIGDVVNDPQRGPWNSTHNGQNYSGTYDAYEQIVGIAEQVAWVHHFSNGKTYDPGDILIALGEYLIKQGELD